MSQTLRRRTPRTELGTELRDRFARNVRHFRKAKGMTQAELAGAAGVGRSFVSLIERGHFSVTLETVGAIAAALGTSPARLIEPVD